MQEIPFNWVIDTICAEAICALIVGVCLVVICLCPRFFQSNVVTIIVMAFAWLIAIASIGVASAYLDNKLNALNETKGDDQTSMQERLEQFEPEESTLYEIRVNDQTDWAEFFEQFEVVDTSKYPVITVKLK